VTNGSILDTDIASSSTTY